MYHTKVPVATVTILDQLIQRRLRLPHGPAGISDVTNVTG